MAARTITRLLPSFHRRRWPTSVFSNLFSYSSIAAHPPSCLIPTRPTPSIVHHAAPPLISPSASSATLNSSASNFQPLWVNNFETLVDEARNSTRDCGDKRHWLAVTGCSGLEFDTEKALLDFYIQPLVTVIGSEVKAKKSIYLVSCGPLFGFGTEIDEDAIKVLRGRRPFLNIYEDPHYGAWNKGLSVRSAASFTPRNQNYRLDNIFSYHHLSEQKSEWNSDHWLINIKEPHGRFTTSYQTIKFCIKVLAEVVGSEVEAERKIYIIWTKFPFGFAAKIDEETSNKLKGLPDVVKVLPDYAFDVKFDCGGHLVLCISPP